TAVTYPEFYQTVIVLKTSLSIICWSAGIIVSEILESVKIEGWSHSNMAGTARRFHHPPVQLLVLPPARRDKQAVLRIPRGYTLTVRVPLIAIPAVNELFDDRYRRRILYSINFSF